MSLDKIFDLTAGVYFIFIIYICILSKANKHFHSDGFGLRSPVVKIEKKKTESATSIVVTVAALMRRSLSHLTVATAVGSSQLGEESSYLF